MKETVQFESAELEVELPDDVVAQMRDFRSRIAERSLIVWGEHCSECAFPSCYSQCTYYSPRADMHCRRFENGIEAVSGAPGVDLMRITFRRWGKLEGQGPAVIAGAAAADRMERRDKLVSNLLNLRAVPRRIARGLIYRWNTFKGRAAGTPAPGSQFVVETWLDPARNTAPIPFTLTVLDKSKQSDALFQTPFEVRPGYNRWMVAAEEIARMTVLSAPFLVQIEPVGDAPNTPVLFGMTDFVIARTGEMLTAVGAKLGIKPKTAKCVVWDLDDTLWDGTLAEDGIEGLRLRPAAVDLIRTLDARGILMSVASKNDPDLALAALEHFGLRSYFLFPQVGWEPKSTSIQKIAELLDIGTDTFVFIDDQPFERGEVQSAVPDVTVIDASDVAGLADHPLFDVPATAESSRRRAMYQTEETRQSVFQASGSDYLAFLRDCQIELRVQTLDEASLERVYELTQRTNQLNFSGARYDRAELKAMIGQAGRTYVMGCRDKFGDYGIIGFAVADREKAEIESFFMSCRVQRKRVEHALFEHLRTQWDRPAQLRVRFRPTAKNAASVRLLEALGFTPDGTDFVRPGDAAFSDSDIVAVQSGAIA